METIKETVNKVINLEVGQSLEIVSDYKYFLIKCERIGNDAFKFSHYEVGGALYNFIEEDVVKTRHIEPLLENYLEITKDENGNFNFEIV